MIETIPCNFCGSKENNVYDELENWKIVKCNNCGFTFTNPRPTLESLPQYYAEEYFKDERHRAKFYNEDSTVKVINQDYTNRIQDVENYVPKRGSVLEIGCARGGFLSKLRDRGWEIEGVEISQDACNLAKELYGIDQFCGVFAEYQTTKKFDVICMYQTLEHVPDPKEVLEKAYQMLKPNGVVVVEIPNINCLEMKYSADRRRLSYDLPRHLNHFSPQFLSEQMKKMGYQIADIECNEHPLITSYFEKKRSSNNQPASISQEKNGNATIESKNIPMLLKPNTTKSKVLKKINSIFPGWRFTIVGRKI